MSFKSAKGNSMLALYNGVKFESLGTDLLLFLNANSLEDLIPKDVNNFSYEN